MRLVILVCQLGLILRIEAQLPAVCITNTTNKPPENSDITVVCGTEYMDLSIYLCPVYQASYNESLMVLNDQKDTPECFGTADWSVDPPVLKFRFPLNESSISSCKNNFKIITSGTGLFDDFSSTQLVKISGTVSSIDLHDLPSVGSIIYHSQILYKYSCIYPMQYFMNSNQLGVSGVSLAIRDNNGSFISTLSMLLYKDKLYRETLTIPRTGLNPKTRIYVAVKATNLTRRFNVLLDRCYASTSPHPKLSSYYDLFVGCERDAKTKVELNGDSQRAHFSFETFRFVEHINQTISTFYLHCVTRLCEVSSCSTLKPDCGSFFRRWSREAHYKSNSTTITSPAIRVGKLSTGVTVGPSRPTDIPSSHQTEINIKYGMTPVVTVHTVTVSVLLLTLVFALHRRERASVKTPIYILSVLEGRSSLSCYSRPFSVVAIIVFNVILTICISV